MNAHFDPLASLQISYQQLKERENDNTMLAINSIPFVGGLIAWLRIGHFPDPSYEPSMTRRIDLYLQREACLEFALKAEIIHSITTGIFLGLLAGTTKENANMGSRCQTTFVASILSTCLLGFPATLLTLWEISHNRRQAENLMNGYLSTRVGKSKFRL